MRLIQITPGTSSRSRADQRERRDLAAGDKGWCAIAGAERAAARRSIGVGETYDFEYQAPAGRQTLWLEVKNPGGSGTPRDT